MPAEGEESRPRGMSMGRPRTHTLNKRKCVDASSQTMFKIIVVDNSGQPIETSGSSGNLKIEEFLNEELVRQMDESGEIENLLK